MWPPFFWDHRDAPPGGVYARLGGWDPLPPRALKTKSDINAVLLRFSLLEKICVLSRRFFLRRVFDGSALPSPIPLLGPGQTARPRAPLPAAGRRLPRAGPRPAAPAGVPEGHHPGPRAEAARAAGGEPPAARRQRCPGPAVGRGPQSGGSGMRSRGRDAPPRPHRVLPPAHSLAFPKKGQVCIPWNRVAVFLCGFSCWDDCTSMAATMSFPCLSKVSGPCLRSHSHISEHAHRMQNG